MAARAASAPTTALRMAAIHSNATRLLPNPMLPNAAKADQNGHAQGKANHHLDRFQFSRQVRELRQGCKLAASGEIVAQDRLVERVCVLRHAWDAGPVSTGALRRRASTKALRIASARSA